MNTIIHTQEYQAEALRQQLANLKREVANLEYLINQQNPANNLKTLLDDVCHFFNIPARLLVGDTNQSHIVSARLCFANIARHLLGYSTTEIGRFIKRDHSTVIFHTVHNKLKYRVRDYPKDRPALLEVIKKYDKNNFFQITD